MKKRTTFATLTMTCLTVTSAVSASCDPQQASIKLFRDQGLNLLKPARDYIRVGGIVVRRGGGPMEYIDPQDVVNPTPGGGNPFRATVLAETKQHTAKFGLALGAIKSILPGAVDLSGEADTEVKLNQINATGLRLTDDEMRTLIEKKETASEITADLNDKLDVWVIQEVLSTDELSVTAQKQGMFNVGFAGGKAVQECAAAKSKPGSTEAKPAESKAADAKVAAGKPSGGKTADGKSVDSKPAENKAAEGKAADNKPADTKGASGQSGEKTADQTAAAKKEEGSKDQQKFSLGIGVCRLGTSTLSFKSTTPGETIPFAVRLKQVELRNGKPSLRRGIIAPNATLGPNRPRFALVDRQMPVIPELQRRKPRQQ